MWGGCGLEVGWRWVGGGLEVGRMWVCETISWLASLLATYQLHHYV